MRFTKQTITLTTESGAITVDAFVSGNVAYHRPMGNMAGWNITHIPSGAGIGRASIVSRARQVAAAWKPICDVVTESDIERARAAFMATPGFEAALLASRQLAYKAYSEA